MQFSVQPGCLTTSCHSHIGGNMEDNKWERFRNYEYLVHDSCAQTLSEAAATCRLQGGQLLSIKSSAEMRFVERLLRSRAYDMEDAPNWWTSGIESQDRWQWQGSSTSVLLLTFTKILTRLET